MPVEFECRSEDPPIVASTYSQPQRPAETKRSLLRGAFYTGLAAALVAFAAGLFALVGIARKEMALQQERQLLVGRCFDNGIGGVGRLIEVWTNDRGLLAFSDGHTTPYPFASITKRPCP